MKKILVAMPLDDKTLTRLRALPGASVEVRIPEKHPWEFPGDQLRDVHLLLCKSAPKNFADLASLEFMQIASVGFEHLRHLQLADKPIRVCNAKGIFEGAIAEWNLAMMVNLVRDLRAMIYNQERAIWEKADRFQLEIRGMTVGLWGYGGIGRDTARLAKAFGMTVHVFTRNGVKPRHDAFTLPGTGDPEGVLPDRVFTSGQEMEFLRDLDFLVLALPLNQNTDGLLGEKELQALPKRAFILNPARGPIIKEQALLKALREGWIAGAALDTHYAYPLPPDHPLWAFRNVILTPHISGADHSQHFLGRISQLCLTNVERFLNKQPLLNEVTAKEWRET